MGGGGGLEEEGAFAAGALVGGGGGGESEGREQGLGLEDVVDLEAEVVESGAVFFEPLLERMSGLERLDELEMGVAEVEVGEADGAVVDDLAEEDAEADAIAPDAQGILRVRDDDRHVVEASKERVIHGRGEREAV